MIRSAGAVRLSLFLQLTTAPAALTHVPRKANKNVDSKEHPLSPLEEEDHRVVVVVAPVRHPGVKLIKTPLFHSHSHIESRPSELEKNLTPTRPAITREETNPANRFIHLFT